MSKASLDIDAEERRRKWLEAQKTRSRTLHTRVSEENGKLIDELAAAENRTVSNYLARLIDLHLEAIKK